MEAKQELCEWIKSNAEQQNGVWVFINGGEATLLSPEETEHLVSDILSDDYYDNIEKVEKGKECDEFASRMSKDEYDGTDCFYRIMYRGTEFPSADIEIQYWN